MFNNDTKVLIVDDMASMRVLIKKVFREAGFIDVHEAADGAIAWKMIEESVPNYELVIADWSMPKTSGLDLAKRIRADARLHTLPLLMMLTEADRTEFESTSMKIDFILKPFNAHTLAEKLKSLHSSLSLSLQLPVESQS